MRIGSLLPLASILVLSACSGTDSTGAPSVGGSTGGGVGGSTAAGGTTSASSSIGGAPSVGGTQPTGGSLATGGSPNTTAQTGGAQPTGGASAMPTGGMSATGGSKATTGGSTAIAGGASTGGAPSIGGSSAATGGKATGGSSSAATGGRATGGSSAAATGGKATGGAATTTGGSTSTGSCVEATCGTHKWPCWKVPTPPAEKLPNPQNLTDLTNGAVRDNVTCLVWEKANPSAQGNWQASYNRCAALGTSKYAGFSDWRLPTRVEMASITDLHGSDGFAPVFTTTSGYYTTGSDWYETITGQNTSGYIWGYGTNGFTSNAIAGGGTGLVARCVRGNGAGEAVDAFAVEPANHYTVASGEVTDNYTGLIWQQAYSGATTLSHADAVTYCSTLSLNGHAGWRVPTLMELASTVNEALVGGAINRTAFPNNPNGCKAPQYWFWASEAYYGNASQFWGLSYCDGFTGYNVGASGDWNYFPTANVRCVR